MFEASFEMQRELGFGQQDIDDLRNMIAGTNPMLPTFYLCTNPMLPTFYLCTHPMLLTFIFAPIRCF